MFEDIDWVQLTAAYYDHPDMRALFEALASDDKDEVAEADEELSPSIMLDGEVFESTAAAIPLLLDLASTAHHGRAEWLWLVGLCVDPEAAVGERLSMVQAAVAAHTDRIIGFLDDPSPDVAAAAAYTLAQCVDRAEVDTALAEHPDQVAAALNGPELEMSPATARTLARYVP